jgi:hypothetical protein
MDIVTVGKSSSHYITPHHCQKDRLFPSPLDGAKTGGAARSPARVPRELLERKFVIYLP